MTIKSASRLFADTAGVLLLALAVAILISNRAHAGVTLPRDPLLGTSIKTTFWIVGGIAMVLSLICLFGKSLQLKTGLILWLALNLLVYQAGMVWNGNHRGMSVYLSSVAHTFGIQPATANVILQIASGYLFIGSILTLLWVCREKAQGYLKAICAKCGGHIAFSPKDLGKQISCPHCQAGLALRQSGENLKMPCFFCKGNIEFPTHAIGEKLKCPHCKMDITLKEPATV